MMRPRMDVNPIYQAASIFDLDQECRARGLLVMWSTVSLAHCGLPAPCLLSPFDRPKPCELVSKVL